jgi:hypothetical protein
LPVFRAPAALTSPFVFNRNPSPHLLPASAPALPSLNKI